MLYLLFEHWDQMSVFNLLRYIAIRASSAIASALVLVFFVSQIISQMHPNRRRGPPVQAEGTSLPVVSRINTRSTDVIVLLSVVTVSTFWANPRNPHLWIMIGAATGFGLIGFHGDIIQTMQQSHNRFARRARILAETIIAVAVWIGIVQIGQEPFAHSPLSAKSPVVSAIISLVLSTVLVIGTANAVKLITNGDRLAIIAVMVAAVVLGLTAYMAGNAGLTNHLQLRYVSGTGEMAIPCAAIVGVCLGLLWFKATSSPALMGDMGTAAIGAAFATVALAIL